MYPARIKHEYMLKNLLAVSGKNSSVELRGVNTCLWKNDIKTRISLIYVGQCRTVISESLSRLWILLGDTISWYSFFAH